jgi:glutaryl-CoA dehydrogenase
VPSASLLNRAVADLLDLDSELPSEVRGLRDTLRAWLGAKVDPHLADWFEQGRLPREIAGELGRLGLLGMHLHGYGCSGSSALAYGVVCRELEASDSGLRSFVSVQGSLAMYAIRTFGSEEHKQRWLPAMATGEAIGCFGLTEPDSGSDPGSMRTRARRDPQGWVLTGAKQWITNGNLADVAIVWARTDDGIRGFVVPTDSPGFAANKIERKLSLRASVTSELVLDDCRLPLDAVLPEARGLSAPLACLNEARYGIVWGAVGAARACMEAAVRYSLERSQFGRPIAGFQLTQAKLVDMAVEVAKAQLLASRLAQLKDRDDLTAQQVSLGKLNNVRVALDIARSARTILGANGISLEYPVFRHMANLESVLTYEGTSEVHTLIVGQALTGLAAFR